MLKFPVPSGKQSVVFTHSPDMCCKQRPYTLDVVSWQEEKSVKNPIGLFGLFGSKFSDHQFMDGLNMFEN